ncbi:MAG: DsbA family protein [Gammaproteobacteria bacterium]
MRFFIKTILCMVLFTLISTTNASVVAGNPLGKVILTEFFDYTSPPCQAMGNVIQQLVKNNPQLRVVYRPIPVLGPNAKFAAESAVSAQRQKKFAVFHTALLNSNQPLTQETILDIAKEVGINTRRLLSDMKNPVMQQDLRSNLQAAHDSKVHYLPTIIITAGNPKKTPPVIFYGKVSLAQLQTAVSNLQQVAQK